MGKKNVIVPCELFNKLWEEAEKCDSKEEYVERATLVSSESRILFYKRYGIKELDALSLLDVVYSARKATFSEILSLSGKKKAAAAKELCVPIRTLEDWVSGKGHCPEYLKLLIMKKWNQLKLPKGLVLEDDPKAKRPRSTKAKVSSKKQKERADLELFSKEYVQSTRYQTYAEMQRALEQRKAEREQKMSRHQWWRDD